MDFPTHLPLTNHGKKWKDEAVQGKSGKYYVSYIHLSYGRTRERAFFFALLLTDDATFYLMHVNVFPHVGFKWVLLLVPFFLWIT